MASCSSNAFNFQDFLLSDDGDDIDELGGLCQENVDYSTKEGFVNEIFNIAPVLEWYHIPFKFTECIPLGCTDSHAFAVIKDGHGHYLVYIPLNLDGFSSPFMCVKRGTVYRSPWKQRMEEFSDFLGGCAFGNCVCIVTKEMVVVYNTEWNIQMLNSQIKFSKVLCCDINDEFLVIAGRLGQKDASIVIRWRVSPAIIIRNALPRAFKALMLSKFLGNNIMFLSVIDDDESVRAYEISHPYEHQLGMIAPVDDEEDDFSASVERPKWNFRFKQNMMLGAAFRSVTIVKELSSRSVVHASGGIAVGLFEDEGLRQRILEEAEIIDVGTLSHEITVIHDSINAIRFYDRFERELYVITNDSIMEPYANGIVPRSEYLPIQPYNSLGRYQEHTRSLPVLLNSGALVMIILGSELLY